MRRPNAIEPAAGQLAGVTLVDITALGRYLAGRDAPEQIGKVRAIVASELATNAVVHAKSPFSVVLRAEHSRVRVSVTDDSVAQPLMGERTARADRGRGLALVATLAHR